MLKPAYLSANTLRITEVEREALIDTLHYLETQKIPFIYNPAPAPLPIQLTGMPAGFNMSLVYGVTDCGTTACLCGWARSISRNPKLFCRPQTKTVDLLFGMNGACFFIDKPLSDISLEEATMALRNFLTTGHPDWESVFAAS